MSNQGFRGVPGVPDGWELVRIDFVTEGEWYLFKGRVDRWESKRVSDCDFPIIRKIKKPKQYRPFANAEEFKPHRDRWWRYAVGEEYLPQINPPIPYNELGVDGATWQQAFNGRVFDDGTPFGVEVTSE